MLKMDTKRRRLNSPVTPSAAPTTTSRINQLSDDILLLILSKLTIKEAGRTSVLSHRWQNLWMHSTGSFNFDYFLSYDEKPRFITCLNHILTLHRAPTVDQFRVRYHLDATDADDIEPWIKFAMQKTVSSFELDFSVFYTDFNDCYRFPSKLIFDSPQSTSFRSLTSLRLISVNLSDQLVAYFISNCQSLQHLAIQCAASLTCLDATPALKLKHLEIVACYALKNVVISNTNIESLNFNCQQETRLSLTQLPLLTEVSLAGDWCGRAISLSFSPLPIFSQLQRLQLHLDLSLHLVFGRSKIEFPEVFPTFNNLKHLEVVLWAVADQNIFGLTSMVCASPILNSFTLDVTYCEQSDHLYEFPKCEWRKSEKSVHQCLKVVEFTGWYGYKSEADLVSYLVENAVVLQKVVIDPTPGGLGSKRRKASRESAYKVLRNLYVPPGMDFVIL